MVKFIAIALQQVETGDTGTTDMGFRKRTSPYVAWGSGNDEKFTKYSYCLFLYHMYYKGAPLCIDIV